MIPGKHRVSIAAFAALACLTAGEAGRHSENGMGLQWLVAIDTGTQTLLCSEPVHGQPASLVFEMIQPGEAETELPELLAANAREVVNFEWNPATGELSFRTTQATKIFSDLERSSSQPGFPPSPNCESR